MEEEKILDFITKEYTWEQVLYKVIAWEGLDPWNLDLNVLSTAFLEYINKLKKMDFKIPAKYVMIASVLLRMKSDHLQYMGDLVEGEYIDPDSVEEPQQEEENESVSELEINPISVPPNRYPRKKIVVDDLVKALRSALRSRERRILRKESRKKKIRIEEDNITKRISLLYRKINDLLSRVKKQEVEFSSVVEKWERKEIISNFLPLVFLDHENKVKCRQEEMFREIFIRKPEN